MAQMLNPTADEVVEPLPPEVAAEIAPRLEQVHDELSELRRMLAVLCELAAPLREPAQLTTIVLSKTTPATMEDERGISTASIGLLNPTALTILLGVGGGRASSQARAIAVPPKSLIVLPIAAGDVEVGTEDSLAEGDAVVHLFRWETVQPAFLGAMP